MPLVNKKYDYLVFIARCQPPHFGHFHVINTALKYAEHVIILLGSSNSARTIRNPFTFDERKQIILEYFIGPNPNPHAAGERGMQNLSIFPLNDYTYNDEEWIKQVQQIVFRLTKHQINPKIGLIGHSKDHSSYYLKLFPKWDSIDVTGVDGGEHNLIDATTIRNLYFGAQWHDMSWQDLVPGNVKNTLEKWIDTDEYQSIVNEYKFALEYRKQFENLKYEYIRQTVDSVVIQSGHVILIKRKALPGKGKWALPGGHLEPNETLLNAAIRELREETGLKVPEAVLRGSIKKERTFDDPHRSNLIRTITKAYLFHLAPQLELPKIKGGDDASLARWVPISELKAEELFDDHYFIIQNLIGDL